MKIPLMKRLYYRKCSNIISLIIQHLSNENYIGYFVLKKDINLDLFSPRKKDKTIKTKNRKTKGEKIFFLELFSTLF